MSNEQYVARPGGRFVTFADQPGDPPAPYTWPQDTLTVPNGFGSMPLVNNLNRDLNRREFFGMSARWPATPAGFTSVQTQNLQVPKDGDFWCSGINVVAIDPAAFALADQSVLAGVIAYLMIEDAVTGYSLTQTPYLDDDGAVGLVRGSPWGAFETRNFVAAGPNANPFTIPFGGGTRTDMIQPYCFLRGGAIRLTLSYPGISGGGGGSTPSPVDFYVSLVGWKEYAYAAP